MTSYFNAIVGFEYEIILLKFLPRPFSCGLQLSPFLYVLTVFLQMRAHEVLHKT